MHASQGRVHRHETNVWWMAIATYPPRRTFRRSPLRGSGKSGGWSALHAAPLGLSQIFTSRFLSTFHPYGIHEHAVLSTHHSSLSSATADSEASFSSIIPLLPLRYAAGDPAALDRLHRRAGNPGGCQWLLHALYLCVLRRRDRHL